MTIVDKYLAREILKNLVIVLTVVVGLYVIVEFFNKADNFMEAYRNNVWEQNEAAIEASPVAQAVLTFMEGEDLWEGTATDLLRELTKVAEKSSVDIKSKLWPKVPQSLTYELKRVFPNLLAMGFEVIWHRGANRRSIRIRRIGETDGVCEK